MTDEHESGHPPVPSLAREAAAPSSDERGSQADPPPATPAPRTLPPDPVAYDSARNAAARARGLPLPYIPGGDDPDPATSRREERRYTRLLIAMVAIIVLGGFVLGIVGMVVGAGLGS